MRPAQADAAQAASRSGVFLLLLSTIVASAWFCILYWDRGPYARYLHAVDWADVSPWASLCAAIPAGTVLLPGALFSGAWLLMIAAMMLPTTWPLLHVFSRLVSQRPDRSALLVRLILGYLASWLAFGAVVYVVDAGLHIAGERSGWLALHGWIIGAMVLAIAGLYQFSRLKYACLDRCRSPLTFVMEHWSGADARRDSLRLGVWHGIFCVGCCWSLMVVMLVVGAGSIAWMLGLAAVMAVEKNVSWGRTLARPLGAGLLLCAAAIVAAHAA